MINDGAPALRNLVKLVTGEPVTHNLDWWHIFIGVQHIEQTIDGKLAVETPAPHAAWSVSSDTTTLSVRHNCMNH